MAWRFLSLSFFLLAGGLAGGWIGLEIGALGGAVCGALAWLAVDAWPAGRMLRWLREPDTGTAPVLRGMWGDAVDRMRRALKVRDLAARDAQGRLEEFLAAIQASPNGVVLLDSQGRIEWCNQTAADHFGFDLQRDAAQHVTHLLRDPAFAAYHAGGNFDHDIVIPGPGSTPSRPARISLQLHRYGEGRTLLLSRDVTALEQAETMRRDFVANVSHEIRTPLTVLSGFVETLRNLPLQAEDRARYLELMAQQAQRMQTLVTDLLTLSRLEGSPLPGTGEWTKLEVLTKQCEQEAQALSAVLGRKQELEFADVPDMEISGSPHELLSALSNLVSNAVRYTPDGGSIQVQWRTLPDGQGEFRVRDTGPGIAPEHLPRLTERFYRVDRSRSRETGGTGLGLAIVKHVVQRHGGELKIESSPGAGSTFIVQFPASRLRPVTPAAGTSAQPATESLEG